MGKNLDLASISHWNKIYLLQNIEKPLSNPNWSPSSYSEILISNLIEGIILDKKISSILEVGCGNSPWLAYLGNKYNLKVAGIDYSIEGCKLAKNNLDCEGVDGAIFCENFFNENVDTVGTYDLVFSLGVVEHFSNTNIVIKSLKKYLNDGGILLSEIPNFNYSIHYFISKFWHPKHLNIHKIFGLNFLKNIYRDEGFKNIEGSYFGLFSFDIVAWKVDPRFPYLEKRLYYKIKNINSSLDSLMIRKKLFDSKCVFLSPYFYVLGEK